MSGAPQRGNAACQLHGLHVTEDVAILVAPKFQRNQP
jgi:hypothetical protein